METQPPEAENRGNQDAGRMIIIGSSSPGWLARPWTLLLLLWLAAAWPARAERVTVYTNATFAPLVIDGNTGLYPEMVAYLNRLKLDDCDFALETMPRKRLQAELDKGTLDGIVIGMTPSWWDGST